MHEIYIVHVHVCMKLHVQCIYSSQAFPTQACKVSTHCSLVRGRPGNEAITRMDRAVSATLQGVKAGRERWGARSKEAIKVRWMEAIA